MESLQNNYKNKHFIKQDSQGMGASRVITGPHWGVQVHRWGCWAERNYPGLAGLGWAFSDRTEETPEIFWNSV